MGKPGPGSLPHETGTESQFAQRGKEVATCVRRTESETQKWLASSTCRHRFQVQPLRHGLSLPHLSAQSQQALFQCQLTFLRAHYYGHYSDRRMPLNSKGGELERRLRTRQQAYLYHGTISFFAMHVIRSF